MHSSPHITEALTSFTPISLEEMDGVSLMDRKDTKFVLDARRLPGILRRLQEHYRILEIGGGRTTTYENLYYDTEDFRLYLRHHNGKQNRHKLRYRKYSSSDLYYFEVKFKSNKGRTIKKRIKRKVMNLLLGEEEAGLAARVACPVATTALLPKLWVDFRRITLVNTSIGERVTFDTGLAYRPAGGNGGGIALPGVVIAEHKQDKMASGSPFLRIIKEEHIIPATFSKYCIGTALMNRRLKSNRFKHKLLTLNKLHHGSIART